jgi:competence protein ComEC
MIGADDAAFRAGVMGGLVVLASYFGRKNTAYVSLAAAGIVLTAVNPHALWELGFQLSFMATLGLILFADPLTRFADRLLPFLRRRGGPIAVLKEAIVLTVAAQVLTAPLILVALGQFSPVSLIVNALITPVQPVVLMGGFVTLGAGLLSEALGRIAALVPWAALEYTVAVVAAGAALPYATVSAGADGGLWALLELSVVGMLIGWRAWRRQPP